MMLLFILQASLFGILLIFYLASLFLRPLQSSVSFGIKNLGLHLISAECSSFKMSYYFGLAVPSY